MHRVMGFLLAVLLSYSLVEAVYEYKIDDEITVQYLDAEETVEKVKVIQVFKNAVDKVLETVIPEEGAEKVEPKEIEHVNEAAVLRVGTKERDIESLAYSMLYIVSDRFCVALDKILNNPKVGERPAQYKELKLMLLDYLLTDEALKEMSEGLKTIFSKMIIIGLNGLELDGVGPKDLDYVELR